MIEALLIGLGVFKVIDLLKDASADFGPWPAWMKSLVAIVLALALAAIFVGWDTSYSILIGLAAAGVASILHEAHAWLNLINNQRLQLLIQGTRRPR